ncbi:MAG: hypothetical protein ABEJ72_10245, partial [Candidatus Aenigmatarchaeota archaeon]
REEVPPMDPSEVDIPERTGRDLCDNHLEDHVYGVLENEGLTRDEVEEVSFRVDDGGIYAFHGDREILVVPYDGTDVPHDVGSTGLETACRVLNEMGHKSTYGTDYF